MPVDVQRVLCRNEPTNVIAAFKQTYNFIELCVKHGGQYLRIEAGFDRNHLIPYVKTFDTKDVCDAQSNTFEDIYFPANEYVYLLKVSRFSYSLLMVDCLQRNGRWSYSGFNQVWLGCPPPFCFMPTFDLGFEHGSSHVISRGNFLCNLKEVAVNKDYFFPPTYFDCRQFPVSFLDSGFSVTTPIKTYYFLMKVSLRSTHI